MRISLCITVVLCFGSEGIGMEYILTRDEEKSPMETIDLIKPASNDEYIGKIRKRLQEDSSARAEREKRRRKVLVDQIKAHEAQEVCVQSITHFSFICSSFWGKYQIVINTLTIYPMTKTKGCPNSNQLQTTNQMWPEHWIFEGLVENIVGQGENAGH